MTVANMNKQHESKKQETIEHEKGFIERISQQKKLTVNMLKAQMDNKEQSRLHEQQTDKQYRDHVNTVVTTLDEQEKRIMAEKKSLKNKYAQELKDQMLTQRDKNQKMYNEMDERERNLNQRGLQAYETADHSVNISKLLPGLEHDNNANRKNFARYAQNNNKAPSTALHHGPSHLGKHSPVKAVRNIPQTVRNNPNLTQSQLE